MAEIVANGGPSDDNVQSGFWGILDHVTSHLFDGNDFFAGWGASYSVHGGNGNDNIGGGYMGGTAWGDNGNDLFTMQATGASRTAFGGADNDEFNVWSIGAGTNFCNGGDGIDRLTDNHSGGSDRFNGGAGFDYVEIALGSAAVTVDLLAHTGLGGHAEGDRYLGVEGYRGGNLDDDIAGTGGAEVLVGADGADHLQGRGGADLLIGNNFSNFFSYFTDFSGNADPSYFYFSYSDAFIMNANDSLDDGAADTLLGGAGDDVLIGGVGADSLNGGAGSDSASYVDAGSGQTVDLRSGSGSGSSAGGDVLVSIENLIGSYFGDTLTGNFRRNVLDGQGGSDTLSGGGNADTLFGDDGDDLLNGGQGHDSLTGGAGHDQFVFDIWPRAADADQISDFDLLNDLIVLDDAAFARLAPGPALSPDAFALGAATTRDQHILYDAATGALSYDRDGSGIAEAVLIATLTPGLALEAGNFLVI